MLIPAPFSTSHPFTPKHKTQVMSVVSQLRDSGAALDLNVILDRLTSGRY
jgi:hypothetical protein